MAEIRQIVLAGMTVDRDGLEDAKRILRNPDASATDIQSALTILEDLSPETIAASYARISRDPDRIPKLREKARQDVAQARKSYEAINFGLGHKSIAEHAVFNFDVMGISRLAVEAIEEKRLQSYTEKSQRYILLNGDFILPSELRGTPFESRFIELIERQNTFYNQNIGTLLAWHKTQDYAENFKSLGCADKPKKQEETLLGYAKEDARYVLSMATQAQLGLTVSARNLEALIAKLHSSGVEEFRAIGNDIFTEVDGIAPSIIKYTAATPYLAQTRPALREYVASLKEDLAIIPWARHTSERGDVRLFYPLQRDEAELAGIVFSASDACFELALGMVRSMDGTQRRELRNKADAYQEKHDPKLREYELGDRVAELTMSASAFAQMKRHRMNTLIAQSYDPTLGRTIPPSISGVGLHQKFTEIMDDADTLYSELVNQGMPQEIATYALTNAHRRSVLLDANNRQVHAFGAERLNLPAQWDIRNIARDYVALVQPTSPIMLEHVCGKDRFYDVKERARNG